jgi:DNA-directed RNA polymerase specialized sigma24 family protein
VGAIDDRGNAQNAELTCERFTDSRSQPIRHLAYRVHHNAENEKPIEEVYLRMMRLDQAHLIRNPPAYLFQVANNVLADRGRIPRQTVASEGRTGEAEERADDTANPYERLLLR